MKDEQIKYSNNIEGAVERLELLSRYEGSEMGELWQLLVSLYESYESYVSPEFLKEIEKEIISEAERSHIEYKLVENESQSTHKYTTLEYIG